MVRAAVLYAPAAAGTRRLSAICIAGSTPLAGILTPCFPVHGNIPHRPLASACASRAPTRSRLVAGCCYHMEWDPASNAKPYRGPHLHRCQWCKRDRRNHGLAMVLFSPSPPAAEPRHPIQGTICRSPCPPLLGPGPHRPACHLSC